LAVLLETTQGNVGYYENEKRDINTKTLKELSIIFGVSIDYLLCNDINGIIVLYENANDRQYIISEEQFKILKENNCIYYKNNKRYISINKVLNLNTDSDVSELLDQIEYIQKIEEIFDKPSPTQQDIERLKTIEKIKNLSSDKFNAIKKIIAQITRTARLAFSFFKALNLNWFFIIPLHFDIMHNKSRQAVDKI
jgi:transcriptional regulator with XRE-family HTH domain